MPWVSKLHAAHTSPILRPSQPAWKLGPDTAAQDAGTFPSQTLAGHDQDDLEVERSRLLEKTRHRPFSGRQGHAMQVKRGLR